MKNLSKKLISVIMALLFALAPLSSVFAFKIPWLTTYPSEKEIAETLGAFIKARDVDSIVDMFSQRIKGELADLDKQVKKLLDEIDCDIKEYSWRGHGDTAERNNGHYLKTTSIIIDIPADGKVYSILATYVQAYTNDESRVGLHHLALDLRTPDGTLIDYFTNIQLPGKATLNYKDTFQCSVTKYSWRDIHSQIGYNKLVITSSDESVAKVDSDGIVTAAGRGSARVTVTYINETTGKELEYLYDVTVTFTRWQWIIWYVFFGFLWY